MTVEFFSAKGGVFKLSKGRSEVPNHFLGRSYHQVSSIVVIGPSIIRSSD